MNPQAARKAQEHVSVVSKRYAREIADSVTGTRVYTNSPPLPDYFARQTRIQLRALDTVTALLDLRPLPQGRVCLLNFASYKNPGGKFLDGSMAQEEALCHESTLYPILEAQNQDYYTWNRRNLNRALYRDRALYSPNVLFCREGTCVCADVLTCAAPNFRAFSRYNVGPAAIDANKDALDSRIRFVLDVAVCEGVDTLILGAWGCGVFGQEPKMVADLFFKYLPKSSISNVVFAVPDSHGRNYCAFERALHECGELL